MKGSTLRRANITREKIAMLESLANYNSTYRASAPTGNKQDELDVLWQNFKVASRNEKSSMAFFTTGVFVGVVSTLIMAIIISLIVGYSPLDDINLSVSKPVVSSPKAENLKFTFIPADSKQEATATATVSAETKEYTVQSGDSLESIAIKFYGGFDEAKIKGIEEANQLANPNAIGIGQKLIIPME